MQSNIQHVSLASGVLPPDTTRDLPLDHNGTNQINHVYKKLIKYCSIFYKLRRILPLKVLKQVYFAFVHSHILYAVEIYANTHNLDKLIKLNNKLLRIIRDKPKKTHIIELYEN